MWCVYVGAACQRATKTRGAREWTKSRGFHRKRQIEASHRCSHGSESNDSIRADTHRNLLAPVGLRLGDRRKGCVREHSLVSGVTGTSSEKTKDQTNSFLTDSFRVLFLFRYCTFSLFFPRGFQSSPFLSSFPILRGKRKMVVEEQARKSTRERKAPPSVYEDARKM
jgi:hypothetical protein